VVIAISCAILGPNDFKPSRMGGVVRDFANGKLLAYIPGGFEFVATRDVVQGHVLAMEKGRTGQRYIFGTRHLEMDELVEILERVTGRPRPRLRFSPTVMLPIAHVATFVLTHFFPHVQQKLTPGAVRLLGLRRRADKSKAERELGYRPTSLEDALREAYQWFVEHGEIAPGRARAPEARKGQAAATATAVS
jgi:nucleoside-diphosphate-sugar epimerase